MRAWNLLAWLVVLGVVVAAILTYSALPSEIPVHFDLGGRVTRRDSASLFSWFLLPAIALMLQLLFVALRAGLPRHPERFNFPDKEEFLRLPDAYRAPVVERMQAMMDVMALLVQLVLALVFVLVWLAAHDRASSTLMIVPILLSVMTAPLALVLVSRVSAEVEVQTKEWRAAGSPPRATP
jgi:uncharacterized membrane protein